MIHRSRFAASVLLPALGLLGAATADEPPQGELRYYFSAVDGSRQAYGIYVPRANPPSDEGYPIVMHAHGYGWSVSPNFSLWQRRWADDHGWVLVNVNGRGPNFYDGIGEDDVMRVLEDASKLIAIDRSRILMTGGSMGGTGAYRMGVRRPDTFAGAAPVDGWTDYRLFHKHWYERKDMPDAIEEFRRPLLEAISTLYLAPTARWGDIQLITDGKDVIVWPNNGLRMNAALFNEFTNSQDAYRHELVYNPGRGHGQGYDLRRIYGHFLGITGLERPPSVTVQSTLLRYGKVHWASIDRFGIQGALGRLDVEVVDSTAHVLTRNLDGFSVSLPDSALANRERVQVVADGIPCYDGPPADVSFRAERNEVGALLAWRRTDPDAARLAKRRGLEGPIGEAFLAPFVVAWGTVGATDTVRIARIEAEDFAREWNAFNVHYDAVRARPEDELTIDELRTKNLIVFGTIASSSLLEQMDAAIGLPVRVLDDRVVVRDPVEGDREYVGRKYGAYWVYPNPLTDFSTLVVACKGRFATKADGSVPRGLGYDLEKLQWAWGDYVVFDSDIDDLAYVENVNNKPPVLTYEAGYFVEAGFYDQDWQIDRAIELSRVRACRPERSRLIHVDHVSAASDKDGPGISVRVVDERGGPVDHARVTLAWSVGGTFSRPTNREGIAFFPAPGDLPMKAVTAAVVNVCGTAATYSWPDDRERTAVLHVGEAHEIVVAASPVSAETHPGGSIAFAVTVTNHGSRPVGVLISAPGDPGEVTPQTHELSVAAGKSAEARFVWDAGELSPGDYALPMSVRAEAGALGKVIRTATVMVGIRPERQLYADVVRVITPDRRLGDAFEVVAEVENKDKDWEIMVSASCVIVEARRHLPTQTVRLGPGAKAALRWGPTPGSRPLGAGIYTAKVSLPDIPGAVRQAAFVVK